MKYDDMTFIGYWEVTLDDDVTEFVIRVIGDRVCLGVGLDGRFVEHYALNVAEAKAVAKALRTAANLVAAENARDISTTEAVTAEAAS